MFIECQDGTYFNTDAAVSYSVRDEGDEVYRVVGYVGNGMTFQILAAYIDQERAQKECRNIIFWIRSVQGLERSDSAYLSKFIYSIPKE